MRETFTYPADATGMFVVETSVTCANLDELNSLPDMTTVMRIEETILQSVAAKYLTELIVELDANRMPFAPSTYTKLFAIGVQHYSVTVRYEATEPKHDDLDTNKASQSDMIAAFMNDVQSVMLLRYWQKKMRFSTLHPLRPPVITWHPVKKYTLKSLNPGALRRFKKYWRQRVLNSQR